MFPRATRSRICQALSEAAQTLLEVADAMLAPEATLDVDGLGADRVPDHAPDHVSTTPRPATLRSHVGDPLDAGRATHAPAPAPPAPHPHRRPLRNERERRPGRLPAREQHCISPVARASASLTRPTTPRT